MQQTHFAALYLGMAYTVLFGVLYFVFLAQELLR